MPIDFQAIFNLSPNPYCLLDRQLRYVAANQAYLHVTASRLEDLVGRHVLDAFPNDPADPNNLPAVQVRESFERVLATRQRDVLALIRYRVPRHTPHGVVEEDRYWSATHTPLLDGRGEVAFILQHTTDVTELQQLKQAVQEANPLQTFSAQLEAGVLQRAQAVQETNRTLDAERRHLRRLFDQAPGFVTILRGPQHVFELANRAYYQLTGIRELIGKPVREAMPEVQGQGYFELLDRVFTSAEPFVGQAMELKLQRKPGGPLEQVFVDFVYQPVIEPDGRVAGIFVQGHDVTEKKRLEAERERLAALVEQSSDFIGVGDELGNAIYVNEAGQRMLGLPGMEEVSRWHLIDFFMPEDRAFVEQVIVPTVLREGRWEGEFRFRHFKTGNPIPAFYNVFALKETGSDKVVGIATVSRDISARKQMDAALALHARHSRLVADVGLALTHATGRREMLERCTRALVEHLDAAFARVWLVGEADPRMLVLEASSGLYTHLVGPHGQVPVGQYMIGVIAQERRPYLTNTVLSDAQVSDLEWARREGMTAFAGYPLLVADRLLGVVALFSRHPLDAETLEVVKQVADSMALGVERLRAEQERSQLLTREQAARAEAERANRLKDEFLATVSHELRTPLTAMLGWVQMLRTGMLPENRRQRALETVERNARAQAQLIEDLLDVSRIMAGKLTLAVEPVEVAAVVEAALESVRPAAQAKEIRLQPVLDSAAQVMGDTVRLQQVVWNLLANAVKFTPKGGRVQVVVERRDSSVDITVADTGQGISPDFLPHVFERFRQAEASTTRQHGGLGLGLAIVKHLVELHGATVWAESEGKGRGAVFTVRLPQAVIRRVDLSLSGEAPAPAPAGLAAEYVCPPELAGLRVLVVDDEQDTRELLRVLLERCGMKVLTVGSAAEALELFREMRPDILVSDIGMPGEDGYSLIRKVRALSLEEGGRTPAVALTAYTRAEDRTRVLLAGFKAHVPKPIEPGELLAVLSSLVPSQEH